MKNSLQIAILCLTSMVFCFFIGKYVYLGPIEVELLKLKDEIGKLETQKADLTKHLKEYKKIILPYKTKAPPRILIPGQEQELISSLFSIASETRISFLSCDVKRSIFVLPKKNEEENQPQKSGPVDLKTIQFDENGMAIGAQTDEGSEKEEAEVLPVLFKLEGNYIDLGKFFQKVASNLPLFGIKNLNLQFTGGNFIKGKLEFLFPLKMIPGNPRSGSSLSGNTP